MTIKDIWRLVAGTYFDEPGRCRTCRSPNVSCHASLLDPDHPELHPNVPDLQPVRPWKFGHLYQCLKCGRYWFMHEHAKYLSGITIALWPLAQHWNETRLVLDTPALNVLAEIGGLPDYYSDQISIPCTVLNVSGQRHEKAMVLVARHPPCFWYEPAMVHWADEIKSITPSRLAIPFAVGKAIEEQPEVSMGSRPVGVRDKTGKEYTLDTDRGAGFLDYKGIRGEDLSLSGRRKWWSKTIRATCGADSFYFIDWFDGCERMLVPEAPRHLRS